MEEELQDNQPKGPDLKKHTIRTMYSLMPSEFETIAIETCAWAVEKHKNYKDMATFVFKEFAKKFPSSGKATEGVYHVIAGAHFAASVSHETRAYVHLKIDLVHFILFKSKDSPFDVADL
mmetsp:Transcript_4911/g.8503  ORF Transcript_4911/g.8503 Transcript_4911/m.8503 type:complete len:120 (-) Transcript_4911:291-650(-)